MIYRYFVEGDCEKKFLDCFKSIPFNYYISGKTIVFNVLANKLSTMHFMDLTDETTIIFVYDTDKESESCFKFLKYNHEFCKKFKKIKAIIHLQSIKNFEDELIFSSNYNKITDIFQSEGNKEFKKHFLHCTNLSVKLNKENFDFSKIWTRISNHKEYSVYKDFVKIIYRGN